MNHSLLQQSSRTQLLRQLVYFDEERTGFLKQYFPDDSKRQKSVDALISRYCTMLERLLSDFNEENLNTRVLIGSRLTVHDLEDQTTDALTLVFPAYTEPSAGRISWLSPLGLQLLMVEAEKEYCLEIPSGTIRVRLDDIRFENYGEVEISR